MCQKHSFFCGSLYGIGQYSSDDMRFAHSVCIYFSSSLLFLSDVKRKKKNKEKQKPIGTNLDEATFICFLSNINPSRLCVDASQKFGVVSFSSSPPLSPLHLHTLRFNLIFKHYRRAARLTFESKR